MMYKAYTAKDTQSRGQSGLQEFRSALYGFALH